MRLIDADAAIEAFGLSEKTRKYGGDHSGYDTMMLYEIQDILDDLPTIEQPQTGKWIERECGTEDKQGGWPTVIVCSQCDFPATTFYSEDCESRTQIKTRFCPHCGARMVMK